MTDKAKGRGGRRGCDFSELVDNFAVQTDIIMREVREAISAQIKNGEIVKLTGTVRAQINSTNSMIGVFREITRPEAKEAIKSLESMVKALEDSRKNLPPVRVSFKTK